MLKTKIKTHIEKIKENFDEILVFVGKDKNISNDFLARQLKINNETIVILEEILKKLKTSQSYWER